MCVCVCVCVCVWGGGGVGERLNRNDPLFFDCRELDEAAMTAVAALLYGLPLQSEEADGGDIMEAKSKLFQKYLSLFMNLLNECCSGVVQLPNMENQICCSANQLSVQYTTASALCFAAVQDASDTEGEVTLTRSDSCLHSTLGLGVGSTLGSVVMTTAAPLGERNVSTASLRAVTVEAMSNLLSANIDAGLIHSIG